MYKKLSIIALFVAVATFSMHSYLVLPEPYNNFVLLLFRLSCMLTAVFATLSYINKDDKKQSAVTQPDLHYKSLIDYQKLIKASHQREFWQGKFAIVKAENNKIRKRNRQLFNENMELERRIASVIEQAKDDSARYRMQVDNLKYRLSQQDGLNTPDAAENIGQSFVI